MRIKNCTRSKIVTFMRVAGWDDREEVLEPGELSDDWLYLEDEDVIEIRERKT